MTSHSLSGRPKLGLAAIGLVLFVAAGCGKGEYKGLDAAVEQIYQDCSSEDRNCKTGISKDGEGNATVGVVITFIGSLADYGSEKILCKYRLSESSFEFISGERTHLNTSGTSYSSTVLVNGVDMSDLNKRVCPGTTSSGAPAPAPSMIAPWPSP